jgi:hypothetical protein
VDLTQPLPPNPIGVARLEQTLAGLLEPPAPRPVPPLPPMAAQVSGKTYALEPNPAGLRAVRLGFDSPDVCRCAVIGADGRVTLMRVGLDGVYRMAPGRNDFPAGARGAWLDERTFALEYDEIANLEAYNLVMHFEADRVTLEVTQRTHQGTLRIEGRVTDEEAPLQG